MILITETSARWYDGRHEEPETAFSRALEITEISFFQNTVVLDDGTTPLTLIRCTAAN